MIWQLMRQDMIVRKLPWISLCLVVLTWGAIANFGIPERASSSGLAGALLGGLISLAVLGATCRATLFQAALPIPAWDLFVARLLTLSAFTLLPLLAIAGGYYLAAGWLSFPFQFAMQAAVLAELTILALLSARLPELTAPKWLAALAGTATLLAVALVLVSPPQPDLPWIVLPVCAVAIAALLWRDLAAMPQAFQVAPMDAVAQRPAGRGAGFARPVWWPVFRSFWLPMGILAGSAMYSKLGMWLVVPLALTSFLTLAWYSLRWLWELPVDRRKALAILLVPPMLLAAASQTLWPAGFFRAAALVALTLLAASAFLTMVDWGAMRTEARILALLYAAVFNLGPFVATMLDASCAGRVHGQGRSYLAETLAGHLAKVLPANPALLIAGTLGFLCGLYWIVQRQFASAEFIQSIRSRRNTSGFTIGLDG